MSNLDKADIRKKFKKEIKDDRYIIGISVGAGISALNAVKGGADIILALNSGKYRQMGLSSLAGYLANSNSNNMVMEFGSKELIPLIKNVPIIFGLNATDPMINLRTYIKNIKNAGFHGINNYPTIGLIDGTIGNHLEINGISYDQEVEAIYLANKIDLFTIAFVFNVEQAKKMIQAGADMICVHLGLTRGGNLGAKQALSLVSAKNLTNDIFQVIDKEDRYIFKTIYGGPIQQEADVQFMYKNTTTMGYIGGSIFDRIPYEDAITRKTLEFKHVNRMNDPVLDTIELQYHHTYEYINFVKEYISKHYSEQINLSDLAQILHLSQSYLSRIFKENVGTNFTDYLITFRLDKFINIVTTFSNISNEEASRNVGYDNYSNFSKIFKKRYGQSPKNYRMSSNDKMK
ncbi:transcriptional regulator, AraC family [Anaerovirgula multivorans]|uniref:Transcriptional regulator, AraC family n=1 Tax=Anaerovirgula multivorans TaxID=312168 RepID=A0A239L5Q0_9FIRM|nr:phosphoenolpyruvate hydrolase family protein [Anaerovirgula multivorans]SNT25009.1 transcriptional regulator, AraC family [Anaerovirgula multivorans]